MIEKNTQCIFDVLTGRKEDISPAEITLSLLRFASDNRVLYAFAGKLLEFERVKGADIEAKLEEIIKRGSLYLAKTERTLGFIKEILSRENIFYLVVKTDKKIPFVTYDVDIYVDDSDYQRVKELFVKENLRISSHDGSLGGRLKDRQVNFHRDDLIMIDLHRDFTWQKTGYLAPDIIPRNAGICDELNYPVPSREVEFILNLVHAFYERYYLTMLDFLTLSSFMKSSLDWDLIFKQARKYSWDAALKKILGVFLNLHRRFNAEKSLSLPAWVREAGLKENIEFPYFFSAAFVSGLYAERLIKKGHIDVTALAYFFYTRFKYYLSGRKILPYFTDEAYGHILR